LPIASTRSPTSSASESPSRVAVEFLGALDLQHGEIGTRIVAAGSSPRIRAIGQRDRNLGRRLDDVVVGDDDAALGDDDTRAERGLALRAVRHLRLSPVSWATAAPLCDVTPETASISASTARTHFRFIDLSRILQRFE
jgi:hypothetical protein